MASSGVAWNLSTILKISDGIQDSFWISRLYVGGLKIPHAPASQHLSSINRFGLGPAGLEIWKLCMHHVCATSPRMDRHLCAQIYMIHRHIHAVKNVCVCVMCIYDLYLKNQNIKIFFSPQRIWPWGSAHASFEPNNFQHHPFFLPLAESYNLSLFAVQWLATHRPGQGP